MGWPEYPQPIKDAVKTVVDVAKQENLRITKVEAAALKIRVLQLVAQ